MLAVVLCTVAKKRLTMIQAAVHEFLWLPLYMEVVVMISLALESAW